VVHTKNYQISTCRFTYDGPVSAPGKISIQQKSVSEATGLYDDNRNTAHIFTVQNEIANLCNNSGF